MSDLIPFTSMPQQKREQRLLPCPYPLPESGGVREEVYRAFDANSVLLYVGRSVQTRGRLEQHATTKSWWHLVSEVMIQRDFRFGSAQLDEYDAILNEFPMFNVDGVPWRKIRLSKQPVEMDRIRNRSLIVGAVSRLSRDEVSGRLEVLRLVEPDVYAQFINDPRQMDDGWGDGWGQERAVLTLAEERFFKAFAELHRGPYPLHLRRQRVVVDDQDNIVRVEPARLPPTAGGRAKP